MVTPNYPVSESFNRGRLLHRRPNGDSASSVMTISKPLNQDIFIDELQMVAKNKIQVHEKNPLSVGNFLFVFGFDCGGTFPFFRSSSYSSWYRASLN